MNFEKIYKEHGISEAEQDLIDVAADTQNTPEINQTRILANLILAKEQRKSASTIRVALGGVVMELEKATKEIESFNKTTAETTKQANRLLKWYVVATVVIALSAIVTAGPLIADLIIRAMN